MSLAMCCSVSVNFKFEKKSKQLVIDKSHTSIIPKSLMVTARDSGFSFLPSHVVQ